MEFGVAPPEVVDHGHHGFQFVDLEKHVDGPLLKAPGVARHEKIVIEGGDESDTFHLPPVVADRQQTLDDLRFHLILAYVIPRGRSRCVDQDPEWLGGFDPLLQFIETFAGHTSPPLL